MYPPILGHHRPKYGSFCASSGYLDACVPCALAADDILADVASS
jgi:hypothetical protein